MNVVSEKLLANVEYFQRELSAEMKDRASFKDQLKAAFGSQSIGAKFDAILRCEIKRRSAVIQSRNITLQVRSGSVCLQGSQVNPVLNSPVRSHWSICCVRGLSRESETSIKHGSTQGTLTYMMSPPSLQVTLSTRSGAGRLTGGVSK